MYTLNYFINNGNGKNGPRDQYLELIIQDIPSHLYSTKKKKQLSSKSMLMWNHVLQAIKDKPAGHSVTRNNRTKEEKKGQ